MSPCLTLLLLTLEAVADVLPSRSCPTPALAFAVTFIRRSEAVLRVARYLQQCFRRAVGKEDMTDLLPAVELLAHQAASLVRTLHSITVTIRQLSVLSPADAALVSGVAVLLDTACSAAGASSSKEQEVGAVSVDVPKKRRSRWGDVS